MCSSLIFQVHDLFINAYCKTELMRKLVSLKKCKTSEVYLCGIFIPNIAGLCSNVHGEVTHFKNWKILSWISMF